MNPIHRPPARRQRPPSTGPAGLAARLPAWTAMLLLGLGTACAADLSPVAGANPPAAGSTGEALAAIHALVGDAACDSDAVCRSMPIGAKACGGPEGYFALSTQRSDANRLAKAVAAYNARRVADQVRDGRVSNCSLVTDPGAACLPGNTADDSARRCRLLTRGAGGASQAR